MALDWNTGSHPAVFAINGPKKNEIWCENSCGRPFRSLHVEELESLFFLQNSWISSVSQLIRRFIQFSSYRRKSPQNYGAEASKILLCSHLQAAKFGKPFKTLNHMEHFCCQWNCFSQTQVWKIQKNCQTRWKISAEKRAKKTSLSIQKLQTEFNSFNPDNTVSHSTIQCLLARHNLIGQAAAKKMMLRARTRQDRFRWWRQKRQVGADYWKQFVFSNECRFKLRSDGRLWTRSQTERCNPRFTLSSFNDRRSFTSGVCPCYRLDGVPHQSTEKSDLLDSIHISEEARVQFFSRVGFKLVDDNAPIDPSHVVNEWESRNGIQSVPWPVRICTPLKVFGFLWKLSNGVQNLRICRSRGLSLRHLEQISSE